MPARNEAESERAVSGLRMKTQYWLAELDQHGNPTLIDGAHSRASGANKAAYLIGALGLGKPNRNFAIAQIKLTPCSPSSKGVNHKAIDTLNAARMANHDTAKAR